MRKIKIAVAVLLLASLCLSGCSLFDKGNEYDPFIVALAADKKNTSNADLNNEAYREFILAFSEFSAILSEKLYDAYGGKKETYGIDEENSCFSPLSIYMALAIAAECSKGETRQEILDALGMTYEEISEYTKILYAFCNEEFTYKHEFGGERVCGVKNLTNSVWIDQRISLELSTAEAIANNFNADVFSVPFNSDEARDAIEEYIEDQTNDLINGKINMDPSTVAMLLNTLYIKDIWNDMGDDLKKTKEKYDFKNSNGNIESISLLQSYYAQGSVYAADNYSAFYAETENGFKLHFLLPNEGYSAGDIFTADTVSTILSMENYGGVDHINGRIHNTRVLFPEFEADFDGDIADVLKNDFGIESLFSPELCDMSFISSDQIWCDQVIHRTKLEVDEKGIEGAAITAVMMKDNAASPGEYEKVYHDFVIDRAFAFVLTDSYGTVMFSGVINTVE